MKKQRFDQMFLKGLLPVKFNTGQKLGQMIEENPDLPLPFIQDILVGREQIKSGHDTPYVFGEGE